LNIGGGKRLKGDVWENSMIKSNEESLRKTPV
jgi:hypothetical protein